MKTLRDIALQQQAARAPHDDPLVERLLAEVVSLAEEVCVLRDRLDTTQLLLERGEQPSPDAIDAFEADADTVERRLAQHTNWFQEVFERLSGPGESP